MSTASDEPLAPALRIDWNVNHHGVVGLIATGEIDMAVADQFGCALMTALHLPGVIEVQCHLGHSGELLSHLIFDLFVRAGFRVRPQPMV